jgi:hypothetical protein
MLNQDGSALVAQKVTVSLSDDLDGSQATGTVEFALDGKTYEIDLSDSNASKLRKVLSPYVDAGRRPSGRARRGRAAAASSTTVAHRERTMEIRKWAVENGFQVANRGRVSADVVEAYQARNAH